MKDWIKGLDDQDFKQLQTWAEELQDAPEEVQKNILLKLKHKGNAKKEKPIKQSRRWSISINLNYAFYFYELNPE